MQQIILQILDRREAHLDQFEFHFRVGQSALLSYLKSLIYKDKMSKRCMQLTMFLINNSLVRLTVLFGHLSAYSLPKKLGSLL